MLRHFCTTARVGLQKSDPWVVYPCTLQDLAIWLWMKSVAQLAASEVTELYRAVAPQSVGRDRQTTKSKDKPMSVWVNAARQPTKERETDAGPTQAKVKLKSKSRCPYCDNDNHYLNTCGRFGKLTVHQVSKWLKDGKWCRKCDHQHAEGRCTLKRPSPSPVKRCTSPSFTSKPNRFCSAPERYPVLLIDPWVTPQACAAPLFSNYLNEKRSLMPVNECHKPVGVGMFLLTYIK